MNNTIAFVTNQYSCDRIITAAREVADLYDSELVVVSIMNNEYELDPQAIDYLFTRSKEHGASMRLIFREDTMAVMEEVIGQYECRYVVSGMPSSHESVLYDVWKRHPEKTYHTVDPEGKIVEVSLSPTSVSSTSSKA